MSDMIERSLNSSRSWELRIEQQLIVLESGDLPKQVSYLTEWLCAFCHTGSPKLKMAANKPEQPHMSTCG